MSGALNSVLGGGNILGAALNIAGAIFPPLGIATSVANMVTQAVGGAVNQAAQQLSQGAGMPNFLTEAIGKLVKDVLGQLTKPSDGGCDKAAEKQFGDDIKQLMEDLTKQLVDGAKAIQEQGEKCEGGGGGGGGKKGSGSWLIAMAKAMGNAAGQHAGKMVALSKEIEKLQSAEGDDKQQAANAKKASGLQAEFQAETQMFNMLQSAFSNAIKGLGEGMSQMARKG